MECASCAAHGMNRNPDGEHKERQGDNQTQQRKPPSGTGPPAPLELCGGSSSVRRAQSSSLRFLIMSWPNVVTIAFIEAFVVTVLLPELPELAGESLKVRG